MVREVVHGQPATHKVTPPTREQASAQTAQFPIDSVLILNPSTEVAYGSLYQWFEGRVASSPIAVYAPEVPDRLRLVLAPRSLRPVLSADEMDARAAAQARSVVGGSSRSPWRRYIGIAGRYRSIVVLCASDDEVTSGQTVYRIVAQALLSRSIVLVGPRATRTWPGGRGNVDPRRLRELAMIAGAGLLAAGTATIALTAVTLDDALARWSSRRPAP